MKRILSLIMATLLAASALVACETTPAETEQNETKTFGTDAVETDAPAAAYDTNLITKNGVATAHIVVAEGADSLLSFAAEELVYHIQKVSGGAIPVVDTVAGDSLAIVIATPESVPELEELFPDDLAWLRDTGDGDKVRWGSDGFAIRQLDGKLYIFGATPRGALNGVYDFIEDNMGVLWIRADEEIGLIYDEMPTITVTKADYREKSPFEVRGSVSGGTLMFSRNKMNTAGIGAMYDVSAYTALTDIGLEPFIAHHNLKNWIRYSPSYDPNCTEYWSTTPNGTHVASAEDSENANYWSDVTVQCIADGIIAFLDRVGPADIDYVGVYAEDREDVQVYPEMTEPYEYAPGKFITPADDNYLSTVYFSFINKIAAKVAEKYPTVKFSTYAYAEVEAPPAEDFELLDNVYVTYCPYDEDLCADMDDPNIDAAYSDYLHQMAWMDMTSNIQVYDYWGDSTAAPLYERAIWHRMQSSMQLYAANGYNGMIGERSVDGPAYDIWIGWANRTPVRESYYTSDGAWSMNILSFWLYHKLAWNPNEDVDALIDDFCEKVFGEAAPYMREYYRLLDISWAAGRDLVAGEFHNHMKFNRDALAYWDYFIDIEVDGVYIYDAICEALGSAWEAADDDAKVHIRHIKEIYDNAETLFLG